MVLDDEELFFDASSTFALSNQWGGPHALPLPAPLQETQFRVSGWSW
jgi:hypothetical protein